MSDTLYLIDGNWLTYEEAHSLGYTSQKPEIVTLYTDDLTQTQIIRDTSDGTFYNSSEHQWVTDIYDVGLYRKLDDITLYLCEESAQYQAYTDEYLSDIPTHVYFNDVMSDINTLYSTHGITTYQCESYYVKNGDLLIWYDPEEDKYWDNTNKKWLDDAPNTDNAVLQDVFIMPNPGDIYLLPQWEEDLSQMPMRYRSWSFDEQDIQMDTQDPIYCGLSLVFGNDVALVSPMVAFYPDITELNKTFYVYTSKGVVDYQGNSHSQGDTFTGDYMKVYVDSDDDVIFYKGQDQFIFGQSHDESYPELYWCEDEYRTYQEVLNLGYSPTPSDIGLKAADTNVEFDIDDIYDVMENKSLGYYCNGAWYSTLADLNNAGYYLVEKVTERIYLPTSGTYKYFEPSIVKTSISFNTSNYRYNCRSYDNKSDFLWDGHNWFFDPEESFAITEVTYNNFQYQNGYKYVSRLSDMPSSTSASKMHLIVPITASGNPLNKFNAGELNTQMYLYFCYNNTSNESLYYGDCMYAAISYWKLV